jgi:hypothetical protein
MGVRRGLLVVTMVRRRSDILRGSRCVGLRGSTVVRAGVQPEPFACCAEDEDERPEEGGGAAEKRWLHHDTQRRAGILITPAS